LTVDAYVEPSFTAGAFDFWAQTVSGVVGNLAAGTYDVGLCTLSQSANALNGFDATSIMVAQTQSGVANLASKALRPPNRALRQR
jgi:hypothetical protein